VRDLQLLSRWIVLQRQRALQHAHHAALAHDGDLLTIKACAIQAEFCDRVREAVVVIEKDPAKFIQDYLGGEGERDE
jgi:hypothetical protein